MTHEEKKAIWEELKKRDPKAAEFLKQMKEKFGNYELNSVKFKTE